MHNLIDLHLNSRYLEQHGLPKIAYPVAMEEFEAAMQNGSNLPFAAMLSGLQQRCRDTGIDWQKFEPAMERLSNLLAPEDDHPVITAAGDEWWLEIGPVDLNHETVTVQRGNLLVAAIAPREDGRLRVAVFRPLDAKAAEYLIGLARIPHPVHGVCMRENNWEYALDSSAGMGNAYASERGEAYLSYWEKGIGISWDNSEVPGWHCQRDLKARKPVLVATELGVYYARTVPRL